MARNTKIWAVDYRSYRHNYSKRGLTKAEAESIWADLMNHIDETPNQEDYLEEAYMFRGTELVASFEL